MKVKFQINHRLYTSYGDTYHEVTVTIFLPKDPITKEIPYHFHGYLGDTQITYLTGRDVGKWRMVRARFVSIDSLEIAEQRAMDAIERYKESVAKNLSLQSRAKEIVVDFSEYDKPVSVESSNSLSSQKTDLVDYAQTILFNSSLTKENRIDDLPFQFSMPILAIQYRHISFL